MRCFLPLCLALALAAAPAAHAQLSPACAETVRVAENTYQDGNFAETIRLLTPCLDESRASREPAVRVYRLLTMAFLNSDDPARARESLSALVRQYPDYAPDPIQDPPAYTALTAIVRDELVASGAIASAAPPLPRHWSKQRATWLAIGGGLIVVGLTAILAGGSN